MISPELMVWVMAPSLISKLEKPPAGVDQVLSPLKKVAALGVPVADKSINTSGPTLATGLINKPSVKVTMSPSLTFSTLVIGLVAISKD